jgi:hypothetical protein
VLRIKFSAGRQFSASKTASSPSAKTLPATKADETAETNYMIMTTDNSYEILTYEELSNALDKDVTSNNFKIAAEFLYNAVTDWPTFNLQEPTDLVAELKKDIQGKLTYTNIDNYSKQLDLSVDAWKAEATSSLLEMFDFERKNIFDKSVQLESIIEKITKHYRQSNLHQTNKYVKLRDRNRIFY